MTEPMTEVDRAMIAYTNGVLVKWSNSHLLVEFARRLEAAESRLAQVRGAVTDIAAERERQVTLGWTPDHDDEHTDGEIARAAACYALGKDAVTNIGGERVGIWPFETWEWKPKQRRQDLVRAGALIVAEIERLDRIRERATAKP